MNQRVNILPFRAEYQNDIDAMMQAIALEFEEPIFSSTSLRIVDVFALHGNHYWVAMAGGKVVGTIGLMQLSDNNAVLKSMFVDKAFRGQSGSRLLMQTLIVVRDCTGIYLQLDDKDYEVCNAIKVASYSYGDTVKVLFNRIEKCTIPSLGPVCQMVHPNEGSIEVIEIE